MKLPVGAGLLVLVVVALLLPQQASASYAVTHINVTVDLNSSTTAHVTEIYTLSISNASVSQYETSRLALNLTLSDWQQLVGPVLVEHLINPRKGVTDFEFLPGAAERQPNGAGYLAYILLSYDVPNATARYAIAPRESSYSFDRKVFNFATGASGEVLTQNTSLSMLLPHGANVTALFPLPDSPVYASIHGYAAARDLVWDSAEPLSKFELSYTLTEGMQAEVTAFVAAAYSRLGIGAYLIIAAVILAFVLYTYARARR